MGAHPLWAGWAFLAGAGIPLMAALNGGLARSLGSTPAAVAMLFIVGFSASALVLVASGDLAALRALTWAPPQLFTGGLIVAFYILSVTHLAPRFGVANTILFVMVAQIITSSIIDHFGLFGATERPIDTARLIGLALLLIGLGVTQASRSVD